jgi:hypothetical protein
MKNALRHPLTVIACLMTMAAPVSGQSPDAPVLDIAQDHYAAGDTVQFDGPAGLDLFLAGNRVTVAAPVGGSAHLAGRRIAVEAAVTQHLFAAGYSVTATAPVGGNASVTGFEVSLAPVTGNLRAAGSEVTFSGVGGYALVTAGIVTLQGAIAGDAVLVADDIIFGPEARVGGALTIYTADPASITVPDSVAPAARVKIETRKSYDKGVWSDQMPMPMRISVWSVIGGFLIGVVIAGLLTSMVIALAPKAVQNWRELALAHPGRAIWSGFLVTSALVGSGFVLSLTIIGVVLFPVMMILTALAICAGYALGSYVLGVWLWLAIGRTMPEGLLGKFALACLGAFLAGLAWLVPIAGWVFVLGLTLTGIGTLAAFVLPSGWMLQREKA